MTEPAGAAGKVAVGTLWAGGVAMLVPFTPSASRESQFATAAINLVLGVAIGTLVSASARSAVQVAASPARPATPPLPPPYRRP